jgi:hypothetical protein
MGNLESWRMEEEEDGAGAAGAPNIEECQVWLLNGAYQCCEIRKEALISDAKVGADIVVDVYVYRAFHALPSLVPEPLLVDV